MMRTLLLSAALLTLTGTANAQTVINNNNIIINNTNNNDGFNRRGDYEAGQTVNWRNDRLGVEAWLYSDRTNYRPGTGVQLRITLSNYSGKNATYSLPRTGEYALTITNTRTNRVVWSRDRAGNRGAVLRLDNGGTTQYNEVWDQRDAAGRILPMGAYRVDVRALDALPLSATIFLSDKNATRPEVGGGDNGVGNGSPDPRGGTRPRPVGGNGANPPPRGGYVPGAASPVVVGSLTLSAASVKPGDVLRYAYAVTNPNREPVTLSFGSAQTFDVWATPVSRQPAATRTPVWRLGDGVMWTQALQQVTLAPGERKTFTGSWRVGSDIASGQALDVSAFLTTTGAKPGAVGAASVRVSVE